MKRAKAIAATTLLLIILMLTGCHTTKKVVTEATQLTETHQTSDSIATESTTTTTINARPTDVEVSVPEEHLERETTDTTSTLETDLYISTATIKDGKLHHTLQTKPGAKLHATVTVADTTKVTETNTTQKSSREDTRSEQTQKETTRTKQPPDWAGSIIAAILIAAFLYLFLQAVRKRER